MKLVEIISTERTGQDTTDALFVLCETLGKTAVSCKDTPGFIVSSCSSEREPRRALC
jgi:3-hydroxyacyl-CoA dehydrogenase